MSGSTDHLDEASVKFLRAVQMVHGKTAGAELIIEMTNHLGKEWAGRVIYHMLADTYREPGVFQIKVDSSGSGYKKINAIKAVRSLSGMGLGEAKTLVESAELAPQTFNVMPHHVESPSILRREIQDLRDSGLSVIQL